MMKANEEKTFFRTPWLTPNASELHLLLQLTRQRYNLPTQQRRAVAQISALFLVITVGKKRLLSKNNLQKQILA